MEKKIVKTQKYTIEVEVYEDGGAEMTRTNVGFNANELLGVLEFAQQEIIATIKGEIKPSIINRNVVKD